MQLSKLTKLYTNAAHLYKIIKKVNDIIKPKGIKY